MSWTAIGMIALAMAMMLGPILIMRPSRWQKRLASMRQEANTQGFQVQMSHFDGESVAVYERPWPRGTVQEDRQRGRLSEWMLMRRNYNHELHLAGVWQWQDGQRPPEAVQSWLAEALTELPESVVAVRATKLGFGCYWQESGGMDVFHAILRWIRSGADAIWASVNRT